jgi:hypothetical protein
MSAEHEQAHRSRAYATRGEGGLLE